MTSNLTMATRIMRLIIFFVMANAYNYGIWNISRLLTRIKLESGGLGGFRTTRLIIEGKMWRSREARTITRWLSIPTLQSFFRLANLKFCSRFPRFCALTCTFFFFLLFCSLTRINNHHALLYQVQQDLSLKGERERERERDEKDDLIATKRARRKKKNKTK